VLEAVREDYRTLSFVVLTEPIRRAVIKYFGDPTFASTYSPVTALQYLHKHFPQEPSSSDVLTMGSKVEIVHMAARVDLIGQTATVEKVGEERATLKLERNDSEFINAKFANLRLLPGEPEAMVVSDDQMDVDKTPADAPPCQQEQRDLHRRGLEVVKNAVRLTRATKAQIRQSPCEDIFNRTTKSGKLAVDGKRQQTKGDPEWTPAVRAQLEGAIRAQGVLRCSQGEKSLARLVAIRSLPRTHHRKKHQPRHADSAERNSLRDQRPEDVPLACIVALQDGTRLHVWPFDTGKEEEVVLNAGDMLLFRGDLGHAGAEYDEENWRLHVYIDSPVIERQTDEAGATLTFPF